MWTPIENKKKSFAEQADAIWGAKYKKINGEMRIITYSFDNTKRIYNLDREQEKVFTIDKDIVAGAIELNNGNIIIYLLDNNIYYYNIKIDQIHIIGQHEDFINGILVYSDNLLISYSDDGKVSFWDLTKQLNSNISTIQYNYNIKNVFLSNKYIYICTVSTINIYKIINKSVHHINIINTFTDNIDKVLIEKEYVIITLLNGNIYLLLDLNITQLLYTHNKKLIDIKFKDNKIYSICEDKIFYIYDILLNKIIFTTYLPKDQILSFDILKNKLIFINGTKLLSYDLKDNK